MIAAVWTVALLLTAVVAAQAPAMPQFRPVGTVKDIMLGVIDPAADAIWGAVWTEDSERGVIEHQPETEEEWTAVEHDALLLAEAANLLKMPGRAVARPEELQGKSTSDPAELTPAQIADRIARSRPAYLKFADSLQDAAVHAMDAARAKDVKATFEAGRRIYAACVAFHQTYWYPGSGQPSQKREVGR